MPQEVAEVDEVERLALQAGEAGHELQRLGAGAAHLGGDLGHVRDRGLANDSMRARPASPLVPVDDRHRGEVAVRLAARLLGDAVEQVDVALDEAVATSSPPPSWPMAGTTLGASGWPIMTSSEPTSHLASGASAEAVS